MDDRNSLNRREFLCRTGKDVIGVGLGICAFASCSKNTAPGSDPQTDTTVPSSLTTDASHMISLDLATYVNLKTSGGSYRLSVQASSGTKLISVTRISASLAATVLAVCTHQACNIGWYQSSQQSFSCPCHGSQFQADGTVIQGPATTSLTTYPTTISATTIQVTIV